MTDDDRFRLLFGPYRTPVFRYGDDAFCELRGDVILCGLTDALIPWPTGKKRQKGSRADDVMGYWQVEAEGPPGCLRVVAFHPAEDDEGLDVAEPIVVEGELVVIRHPARGQFRAVVEWQLREARRVR